MHFAKPETTVPHVLETQELGSQHISYTPYSTCTATDFTLYLPDKRPQKTQDRLMPTKATDRHLRDPARVSRRIPATSSGTPPANTSFYTVSSIYSHLCRTPPGVKEGDGLQ